MTQVSQVSMAVPPTQNTAPVIEYRCLFTNDTKRKHKRWSDGRLRHHTFNKRLMVYDESGTFVGDAYWRRDGDFGEGEELELDRGGILVETGECLGQKDQDLSELLDQRAKEKEKRGVRAPSMPPSPFLARQNALPPAATPIFERPKTLAAVLGTPSGHYGRATTSIVSPFERRQVNRPEPDTSKSVERPAKRRRPNDESSSKSGYAQNLTGATLNLASQPSTQLRRSEQQKIKPLSIRPDSTNTCNNETKPKPAPLTSITTLDSRPILERRPVNSGRQSLKPRKQEQTYANSLAGATLSLKAPTPRAVETIMLDSPPRKATPSPRGLPASKLPPDIKSTRNTDPLSKTRKTKGPEKETSKGKAKKAANAILDTTNSSNVETSVSFESATKPTSTLQIKSRPPQKMMMLMKLPPPLSARPNKKLPFSHNTNQNSRDSKTSENDNSPGSHITSHQPSKHIEASFDPFEDIEESRTGKIHSRPVELQRSNEHHAQTSPSLVIDNESYDKDNYNDDDDNDDNNDNNNEALTHLDQNPISPAVDTLLAANSISPRKDIELGDKPNTETLQDTTKQQDLKKSPISEDIDMQDIIPSPLEPASVSHDQPPLPPPSDLQPGILDAIDQTSDYSSSSSSFDIETIQPPSLDQPGASPIVDNEQARNGPLEQDQNDPCIPCIVELQRNQIGTMANIAPKTPSPRRIGMTSATPRFRALISQSAGRPGPIGASDNGEGARPNTDVPSPDSRSGSGGEVEVKDEPEDSLQDRTVGTSRATTATASSNATSNERTTGQARRTGCGMARAATMTAGGSRNQDFTRTVTAARGPNLLRAHSDSVAGATLHSHPPAQRGDGAWSNEAFDLFGVRAPPTRAEVKTEPSH